MPATIASSAPLISASHEHEWRLRGVEFEDGISVTCYECTGCPDCRFVA